MDARITFAEAPDDQDSVNLAELATMLRADLDVAIDVEKETRPGRMGDLATTIFIVSLAVKAIGTLVAILAYWQSQRPQYSVTITRGDVSVTVSNLSPQQIQDAISTLTVGQSSTHMRITINR